MGVCQRTIPFELGGDEQTGAAVSDSALGDQAAREPKGTQSAGVGDVAFRPIARWSGRPQPMAAEKRGVHRIDRIDASSSQVVPQVAQGMHDEPVDAMPIVACQ